MNNYVKIKNVEDLPRLPLEGSIDLTYRCNNDCRHWFICGGEPLVKPDFI